jgi:hypothetical protein
MKILVSTSDKYSHLLVPYTTLFNKYWPGQEVTFLGYDDSSLPKLPDNFNFVSLGKQDNSSWSSPLIPYIDSLEDEHFIFTMEDMVLVDHVDVEKMKLLENEIISGNAEKVILETCLNIYSTEYKPGIAQIKPDAPYRTTLIPCIWKKDYFLKYLKPNFSAWDFEIENMLESKKDGANIISPSGWIENNVFKTANVYKKGHPFPRFNRGEKFPWGCVTGIKKEDILLIYKYVLQKNKNKKNLLHKIENMLEDNKLYH